MADLVQMIGKRIGRWTVIARAADRDTKSKRFSLTYWSCKCDCGTIKEVRAASLLRGKSKSCGCYLTEYRAAMVTHGLTGSAEHKTWQNMLNRCRNPNIPGFEHYGGRGIKVCGRWTESFENFHADMGPRPSENHSIDRIDVNGPYDQMNCRWSTATEQVANRRKIGAIQQFSMDELLQEIERRTRNQESGNRAA